MRHLVNAVLLSMVSVLSTVSEAIVVAIDDFSIVRNGTEFFSDTFADGIVPPSSPFGPTSYSLTGAFPSTAESGGKLTLDSQNGGSTVNAVGQARRNLGALLLTDATPGNTTAGLKSDDTLRLTGTFGLVTPSGPLFSTYAITFQDSALGGTHQIAQLGVRTSTNQAEIYYILQDIDAGTITTLGTLQFTPPVGTDQIRLQLDRPDVANKNFYASFSYLALGTEVGGGAFDTPAQLFQGEEFVRARFFAAQDAAPVPEPNSALLVALGCVAILIVRRRSSYVLASDAGPRGLQGA